MFAKLLKKIKGDRKYFAIVFFILALIFVSGILSPILVDHLKNNWPKELSVKIARIQYSVNELFNKKEDNLLLDGSTLKTKLRKVLNPRNSSYGALIKLVNNDEFKGYSIEVLAPNGKLIAWNSIVALPQNDIFPLSFPPGQAHFYNASLVTYITVTDTVLSENDLFYFVLSKPFEKQYTIQNPYYVPVSFTKEISDKFLTQFKVDFSPFSEKTRDGREYSFYLVNKQGNKIGLVTFFKPALSITIDSFYQATTEIQAILTFLVYLFIGLGFRKEFNSIKYRSTKLLIFTVYCIAYRFLLYYLEFPTSLLSGPLVDPSNYSSTFGNGIVRSPVEFFVTAFFVLIICIRGFSYLLDYLNTSVNKKYKNIIIFFLLYFPAAFLFLIALRGLSSAVKSIVFDSSLRYFKEPNLIPNLTSLTMIFNLLLLGTAVVLFLSGLILLLMAYLPKDDTKKSKYYYGGLYVSFQIFGLLYIYFQREPLIIPLISLAFITLIFGLVYGIYFINIKNVFNYVYLTLIASIISIILLNYFNLKLEKISLRTTAFEINRPNDNLLRFVLAETLKNAASNENVITNFYNREANYNAEAFKLWANSSLQRESINSSLTIWNKNQDILGMFSAGINLGNEPLNQFKDYTGTQPKIIETLQPGDTTQRVLTGIIPVYDRDMNLGYVSASIGFNLQNLGSNSIPYFLESKKNIVNSVLDINLLKIFKFSGSKLTQVFGNIYPSRDQIKPILNAKLSRDNEAWLEITLNGQDYYTYIRKTEEKGKDITTAILTRERPMSWDLFNFFKIFLIHSIFIVLLLLIFLLTRIKQLKYSFRSQLLLAFLFISIIPVIVLAVYNRQVTQQRSERAIFSELNERSNYVESNIRREMSLTNSGDIFKAFKDVSNELGISFSVYEGTIQIYNSRDQYYKIGLITDRLNPEVYYELNYLSYRDYLTKEKINNFIYDAFYKKVNIDGRPFIIGVNDAFNKVRLTFSVMSNDVFLFGVYSFATLIMIIISTFLANRISFPIRKLTKATGSIAHGDFNVELKNNEKGEMKDLYNGFNSMTKELQKNQVELAELERENAWKEMAKQVAHEIKNPLTPMKLALQQLVVAYKDKNIKFDSVFEKVTSTILNQIENLSLIASEFSRFARMPNFKLEKIDIIPVVNDTVNLFMEEKIKINITTALSSALVEADNSQLRRLFINLIRNSIQANADKIGITISREDNIFVILLDDNGTGIPHEIRDKIFESGFTTKAKGMGLGLKLAKRFIEGINGSIEIIEKNKPGAAFRITIPKYTENNLNKV